MKKFLSFFYTNSWVNLACMFTLAILLLIQTWAGWLFLMLYFFGWAWKKHSEF